MPSIDKRITEMRFDNAQFERGIAQSMKSLDKLQEKLGMKEASVGIDELHKRLQTVSLASLAQSVGDISKRFTTLGIVGVTAIQNITNSAINAGKQMARSLSVDQLSAGFGKYEQKMSSVQTIMNATGLSIEQVSKHLDDLMWFSDETSYGFTDMTAALATMTASGGDVEKLIPMIMGVANSTAYAGKGAAEFSRVMYNLNQSYGLGHLQAMDWKSVEMAGAGSKQLKQMLIEAGVAAGTLKEGQVDVGNFMDSLKDGWANKAVMEGAFGKFAEFTLAVKEAVDNGTYETASEAMEAMYKNYGEIGVTAFRSAQQAKSFTEAIEATKDAVSSGWMRSFELIFGNLKEATALWTAVTNTLWDIFASGAEKRNETLKEWKDFGGRDNLIRGVATLVNTLTTIGGRVKEAWNAVFNPLSSRDLANKSLSFRDRMRAMFIWLHKDSGDGVSRLDRITSIFKGFFSVLKIGVDIVSTVAKAIGSMFSKSFGPAADGILPFLGKLGNSIAEFSKSEKFATILNKIFGGVASVLGPIVGVIMSMGGALLNTISDLLGITDDKTLADPDRVTFATKIKEIYGSISETLGPIIATISGLATTAWNTISDLLGFGPKTEGKSEKELAERKAWAKDIRSFFTSIGEALGPFFNKIGTFLKGVPGFVSGIGTFVKGLYTYLTTSDKVKAWWDSVKNFFAPVIAILGGWWQSVKTFVSNLFGLGKDESGGEKKSFIETLKEKFATPEGIKEYFDTLFANISKWVKEFPAKVKAAISNAIESIKSFFKKENTKVDPDTMSPLQIFFAKAGNLAREVGKFIKDWWWAIGLGVIVFKIGRFFSRLNYTLSLFGKGFLNKYRGEGLGNTFLKLAGSIALIGGAIYILGNMDEGALSRGLKAVGLIAGVLVAISVLGKVANLDSGIGMDMLAMAGSVFLIIMSIKSVIKVLESITSAGDAGRLALAAGIVGGILVLMTVIAKLLNGVQLKTNKHAWKSVLAIAASVWLIVQGLKPLAKISWGGLAKMAAGLLVIGGVISALVWVSAMSAKGSKGSTTKIKGMIGMALGIALLIRILRPMAKMSWGEIGRMLAVFGAISLGLGLMGKVISNLKFENAVGLLLVAGSIAAIIHILGNTLTTIKNVDEGKIRSFTQGLALIIGAMALNTFAVKNMTVGGGFGSLLSFFGAGGLIWVVGDALAKIKDVNSATIDSFVYGAAILIGVLGIKDLVAKVQPLAGLGSLLSSGGLSIVVFALGHAISLIENVDPDKITAFTNGAALLLGVGGAAAGLLSFIGPMAAVGGFGALISDVGIAAVVLSLGHAISSIIDVNADQISAFTSGAALLLGVGGATTGLLSLIGPMALVGGVGALIGDVGVSAVVLSLGNAISKITEVNADQISAFTKGAAILLGVGGVTTGLLSFLGPMAAVGGFGALLGDVGVSAVVLSLGEALSKVTEVKPDQISAFTSGAAILLGVGGVKTGLLSFLGPMAIVGGIGSLIGDLGLSAVVLSLGNALNAVGSSDVTVDQINAFVEGVSTLLGNGTAQTATTGLLSLINPFTWLNELATAVKNVSLGTLIGDISKAMVDMKAATITEEDTTSFMSSIQQVVGFADEVNKDVTLGTIIKDAFGSGMQSLATQMSAFSTGVSDFHGTVLGISEPESFDAKTTEVIGIATKLGTFVSQLPDLNLEHYSGFQRFWGAKTETDKFKLNLDAFSLAITGMAAQFETIIVGDFSSKVDEALKGATSIAGFFKALETDEFVALKDIQNWDSHSYSFLEGLTSLGTLIGDFNQKIGELGTDKFTSVVTALSGFAENISKIQVKDDNVKTLMDSIKTLIVDASTEIQNGETTLNDTWGTLFGASVLDIKQVLALDFVSAAGAIIEQLSKGIEDGSINEPLRKVTEAGANSVETIPFYNLGVNLIDGLVLGLESGELAVVNTMRRIAQAMVKAANDELKIESPSKVFTSIGGYVGSGLESGIKSAIPSVSKTSTNMARAVDSSVRDYLGIHSDSVLMTLLGRFTGSGFVTGLKDKFNDVKKTTTNLMDNVVDTVKGMASGIPDVFKDMLDKEDEWLGQKDDSTGTGGSAKTTTSTSTSTTGRGGRGITSPMVDPIPTEPGLNFGVLGLKLDELNAAVRNMKVVMNNGALVGQIKSEVDRQLGMEALFKGRGM